jgi:hypothetical protein
MRLGLGWRSHRLSVHRRDPGGRRCRRRRCADPGRRAACPGGGRGLPLVDRRRRRRRSGCSALLSPLRRRSRGLLGRMRRACRLRRARRQRGVAAAARGRGQGCAAGGRGGGGRQLRAVAPQRAPRRAAARRSGARAAWSGAHQLCRADVATQRVIRRRNTCFDETLELCKAKPSAIPSSVSYVS